MTREEFIDKVASAVEKIAPNYGICVYSPIIAQACLESAYGTSELAVICANIFGIKYNDQVSNGGKYLKIGSEQNPDGSYVASTMEWCTFVHDEDFSSSVEGYFKFLFGRSGVTRYNNLKGITSPQLYCDTIKADGYATSIYYSDNLMRIIDEYNLYRFDPETPQPMPTTDISPLSTYFNLSPTHRDRAGKKIAVFIPHVYVGHVSAKHGVDHFAQNVGASCSYVIGWDGQVGCSVNETYKPGTTGGDKMVNGYSGNAVDCYAVTVEMASDPTNPYAINDAVENALVNLMADVAIRNGISSWKFKNDPNLVGNWDAQYVLLHRWFASKSCPGPDVISKLPRICEKSNIIINGGQPIPTPTPVMTVAQPTIKKGSKGTEALNLQKNLNYLGYTDDKGSKLDEDGIFGNCSVQSLKTFQKACGLSADGIYGSASYQQMYNQLCK